MSGNCSEKRMVVKEAPSGPEWYSEHMGIWMDEHVPVSVMNITWRLKANGKSC